MKNENNQPESYWWGRGLSLFFRLSSWIVGPILVAVVIGKWLDRRYQTGPWLFLLAIGVAFVISTSGMIKDSLRELKRIDAEEKKK